MTTLTRQTVIHSLFIRISAPPIIEIQRHRQTFEDGELSDTLALPMERVDLNNLAPEDEGVVMAALGDVAAGALEQHRQSEAELQSAQEAAAVASRAEQQTTAELNRATAHVETLEKALEEAEGQIKGLRQLIVEQEAAHAQERELLGLLTNPDASVRDQTYQAFALAQAIAQEQARTARMTKTEEEA
ncbi:hypothetical protein [Deinococcus alpinitundrae]|uniref:hypothetical protein n=1 Tax=Deinococcus alpinitundrae TaxID=468913 RepID=UPI00137A4405|nr:hypothetical protein [Deinococcus alpinitundrae]